MTLRAKWLWLGIVTLVVTCFGVFILPFLLPPAPIEAVSAAVSAGFNNRVAAVAAAAISLAILFAAWKTDLRIDLPADDEGERLSRRFIAGWSLALGLAVLCLGVIEYLSREPFLADYRYFVDQMRKVADYHRVLYAQVELPYGPLMLYPPIWIRGLFRFCEDPLLAAHLAVLFLYEVGGAILVGYILNRLPIGSRAFRLRRWIFVWAVLYMFLPDLGLAYTYLRFAFPAASLIFCIRRQRPLLVAVLFLLAEMLNLGLSAEMGFAFAWGAGAFALTQLLLEKRWEWIVAGLAPIPGAVLFLLIVGPNYLLMLRQISGGAFNFIIEPQPYILFFLFAAVWLVPLLLAARWRARQADAAMLTAAYVLALALLPVALGRADPGHVVLSGLMILLLAAIPVSARKAEEQRLWVAGLLLILCTVQFTTWSIYHYFVQGTVKRAAFERLPLCVRRSIAGSRLPFSAATRAQLLEEHPHIEAPDIFDRIHAITGDAVVATPGFVSQALDRQLRLHHMYLPDYYDYGVGSLSLAAERRENALVNSVEWLVLPEIGLPSIEETPETSQAILGLNFPYKQRHPAFVFGLEERANLAKNWQPVGKVDEYTVYHRKW